MTLMIDYCGVDTGTVLHMTTCILLLLYVCTRRTVLKLVKLITYIQCTKLLVLILLLTRSESDKILLYLCSRS